MKKFLVVVDTQFDFMDPEGALYVPGAETIIPDLSDHILNIKPDEYVGVLATFDTHHPDQYIGSDEHKLFPEHCVKYTQGWSNVLPIHRINNELPVFVLAKEVFDMWDKNVLIHSYNNSIDSMVDRDLYFKDEVKPDEVIIEVIGVASDFCVKQAVDGFVKRGFQVNVVGSLCRGINQTAEEVFDGYETVTVI